MTSPQVRDFRMRICIVETNAEGGLIQFAYHMASSLSDEGAQVSLLTGSEYELSHLPHNFVVWPELHLWSLFDRASDGHRGGRWRQFRPARRVIRGVKFIRAWTHISRRLQSEQPDVVIFSMIHFPFEFFFLRRLASSGMKLIQVCHEIEKRDFDRGWWERRVTDPILKRAYGCFVAIIFLATSVEREFFERYGDVSRRYILPHGPPLFLEGNGSSTQDVRVRYGLSPSDRIVLFFGLLRPSKGVEDLVEAFALMGHRENVRLLIAGYPTKSFDTAGLIRTVQTLGIEDRVSLHLDYVPDTDVRPLLQMAEVLVLPYRNATASGPAAAAQFLRCPIVATDVGGFRDIVCDGVTGRLVPPGSKIALSQAIAELVDNPDRAQAMAAAAYEDQAKNRSWKFFAKEALRLAQGDASESNN